MDIGSNTLYPINNGRSIFDTSHCAVSVGKS